MSASCVGRDCLCALGLSAGLLLLPWGPAWGQSVSDETLARGEVNVDELVALVLSRNPELAEAEARVQAASVRVRQAARLPETQIKAEQWGVPLVRPWALGQADTLMFGVRQTLPSLGSLGGQERVARAEADAVALAKRVRRVELAAATRKAFAAYFLADRQLRLHREHADLVGRLVDLARAGYRSGQRGQQDVLRLTLEQGRVHGDLAHMEPERASAAVMLNALCNREPEAPLGPPAEPPLRAPEGRSAEARAELLVARKMIERGDEALARARAEARWPSFMLGLDYMYMPFSDHPHGYGAMVAVNLPWLSPGRRDEIEAAEKNAAAERRALESTRNKVRWELADAAARWESARASFQVIDKDLLLQAERNLEAAQAAYASGRGEAMMLIDAARMRLDVQVDRVRALAHLIEAAAEVSRAAGEEVTP